MAEKLYKLIEQSTAGWTELGGKYAVSYTHLTLPTTPYE